MFYNPVNLKGNLQKIDKVWCILFLFDRKWKTQSLGVFSLQINHVGF